MASFSRSAANAFSAGYDFASPNKDKSGKTAYQRYVEKFYGPDVTSHRDPIALARAATGAVASGLKSGAGFLSHATAGLVGAPMGPSRNADAAGGSPTLQQQIRGGIGSDRGAVSGITPSNRLYEGNPGIGAGVSAYNPGSSRQGMQGVLDAISRAEGTTKNGYNEVLGSGAYGRPNKPLTEMTLQEAHDFGRNTLGPRWSAATGRPMSTAIGRYQITGTNIKDLAGRWGLNMATTKFTPELQDKMALQILKEQGLTAWEGFKTNPKLKQQAIAAMQGKGTSTSGDPQVAQLQQSLKAAGAKIDVDGIMGPQTRKAMADYPDTAMAYTSTGATTTPALQAAAEQAAGQPSRSGNITRSGEDVAAMQRDLNSRGAKLVVDGKEGPLTRAAAQQFYGSPTSVRTGGFTAPAARTPYTSGQQDTGTVPRAGVYTPQPSSYTSGRGDMGTGVPAPLSAQPRPVQTVAVDASGYPAIQNGFVRDARIPQASPPRANNWSSVQGPYMNSTGGANAWSSLQQPYPAQAPVVQVPTARIPQARPDYQPPQQAVPTASMSLADLQAMAEKYGVPVGHIAQVASDIGNRAAGAYHESTRSGMGYSGGNYSGGSYGGAGGRSISSGVGGAYKNR